MSGCPFHFTRRSFLTAAGGLIAGAGAGFGLRGAVRPIAGSASGPKSDSALSAVETFWGLHQGGIITPAQNHTYFAAFDLATTKREDVIQLLQKWTAASARMAKGLSADPSEQNQEGSANDSGDTLGLSPSRLTITFGFGPGLFVKDGVDRFGLASRRPEALVDLPTFNGDQLVAEHTGGDLSVQACADDPQVAFHAVRQLVRLADYAAQIRWTQAGFIANQPDGSTARNLMGSRTVPAIRRSMMPPPWTNLFGSGTKGRTGCVAAVILSRAVRALRSNIGIA